MAVSDHKCPSCKAPLKFDPKTQGWTCEYCGSKFKIEDLEKNIEKYENLKAEEAHEDASLDVYKCKNCGAEIIADENTSATFCVYCKNTAILKNKLVGKFSPDWVIPFKTTKEDAIMAFKNICKKKPFAPKFFSDPKNIDEMRGIYIPFWLFDCNSNGEITADAKKIKSWTSGDKRYTKTDVYRCIRNGNIQFDRIPVDGSKNFDNALMNSVEPFDYNNLTKFSHAYLSGFLAEKYDEDSTKCFEEAKKRAEESSEDLLKKDIVGYTTVNVINKKFDTTLEKEEYALLPVWLLNIKYNNKIYPFAMNGQTGKLIGDIPIDKKKVIITSIIMFIVIVVIVTLLQFLSGGRF